MMHPGQVAAEIEIVLKAVEAREGLRVPFVASADSLTPRENEVLRLVAAGHSTPQIAEILFISPRTVQTHLTHVYDKLGVTNRAEAIAIALRRDIP